MKIVIQVVEYQTGKVIHEVDVTQYNDRGRNRVENSMNINLNHDHYYTREQEIEDRELIKSH